MAAARPSASGSGDQLAIPHINRTGLQPGATITFSGGDDITATVTSVTDTQILAAITISPTATTSTVFTKRNVTVTNPNGQSSVLVRIFSVSRKQ